MLMAATAVSLNPPAAKLSAMVATLVKVFPLLLFIGLALWFFRGETFAAESLDPRLFASLIHGG